MGEEGYIDDDEDCEDGDCEYCKEYYRLQMLNESGGDYQMQEENGLAEYYP